MKPMDCEQFRLALDAWLDGELAGEEKEAFEKHADTCPDCAERMRQSRDMLRMLSELDEGVTMPLTCQAAWRSAVRREAPAQRARQRTNRALRFSSYAAAALVLVLAGSMLGRGLQSASPVTTGGAYDGMVLEETMSYDTAAYAPDSALGGYAASNTAARLSLEVDGGENDVISVEQKSQAKIIRDAVRKMDSAQFDQDVAAIRDLVDEYEGYTQYSSQSGQPIENGQGGRTASMTIRVPANSLDVFLTSLDAIGTLRTATISADDVTASYTDTQARLEAKRARLDRLKELVASAQTLEDLLTLEDKQNELLYEIESLEAQIKYWDQQVSYSTVNVTVNEVTDKTKVLPVDSALSTRVAEGFYASLNGLREFGQNALVALAMLAPQLIWIVPLLVVALVLINVARRRRRR